ncbi:C-C motif chemokine 3-like [Elephas maximus indicus]|uniref:C-C motif chemokine 3-like n=1 Tax=Elephas maximus indicus TaxID=99487 RepID=UPI0021168948|nr:C-C motif chemokine 3-like [Elephas maximus indicus]
MKVSVAALFILLFNLVLGFQDSSQTNYVYTPSNCCLSYTSRPPPQKVVIAYFKTGGECTKPGVIFFTKKGYHVCANPRSDWVQKYVRDLEQNS